MENTVTQTYATCKCQNKRAATKPVPGKSESFKKNWLGWTWKPNLEFDPSETLLRRTNEIMHDSKLLKELLIYNIAKLMALSPEVV